MRPLGNRKKGQFCVKNESEINVFFRDVCRSEEFEHIR